MIVLRSPLVGKGGTEAEALAALVDPDAEDRAYVAELYRLCKLTGIDFRIAFAQWAHETADGTSPRWLNNRNPAGLGISSDDDPDPAKLTGAQAAAAHVWALEHAVNRGDRLNPILPQRLWETFGHRWENKYRDPRIPNVSRLGDLNIRYVDSSGQRQATWAWDADYGPKLVAKANRIFKEKRMVTKPVIHDLAVDYAKYGLTQSEASILLSKKIPNRLGYQPQGIVFHIQDGSTRGSLKYWVGVQASSTVMANKDGTLLYIIPYRDGPWTNGDVQNPDARGAHLVSLGGGDPNRVSLTCEMEGVPGDPLTPEQENAAVWWALDCMEKYPHIGLDDFYQHANVNSVTRPNCPDGYYWPLMQKIKDAAAGPPPKPKPTIGWIRGEVGLDTYNDSPVFKLVGQAIIVHDTTSRYGASVKSKPFKRYAKGQKVVVVGTFNNRWAVIDAGDGAFPRVAMGRLSPSYPLPSDAQKGA